MLYIIFGVAKKLTFPDTKELRGVTVGYKLYTFLIRLNQQYYISKRLVKNYCKPIHAMQMAPCSGSQCTVLILRKLSRKTRNPNRKCSESFYNSVQYFLTLPIVFLCFRAFGGRPFCFVVSSTWVCVNYSCRQD